MDLNRADTRARLRAAGLRATGPRVAVLQLLDGADRPLSHSDVVACLGEDEWDHSTLYRNLVKLAEVGLARVSSHVAGQRRYELVDSSARHLHPHFVCSACGEVSCLPEVTVTQRVAPDWADALEHAELHFVGRCPPCAAS